MKLDRITLRNFPMLRRKIHDGQFFTDMTTLIGANGTGKTAILQALCRMFGTGCPDNEDFVNAATSTSRPNSREHRHLKLSASLSTFGSSFLNSHPDNPRAPPCHQSTSPNGNRERWQDALLQNPTRGNLARDKPRSTEKSEERLWWVTSEDQEPEDVHKTPF